MTKKKIKIPTKDKKKIEALENVISELMMEIALIKVGV